MPRLQSMPSPIAPEALYSRFCGIFLPFLPVVKSFLHADDHNPVGIIVSDQHFMKAVEYDGKTMKESREVAKSITIMRDQTIKARPTLQKE